MFRELGDTFKWLFYGDDDTMWLRPNPDILVTSYDASKSHVLTGGSRGSELCLCRMCRSGAAAWTPGRQQWAAAAAAAVAAVVRQTCIQA